MFARDTVSFTRTEISGRRFWKLLQDFWKWTVLSTCKWLCFNNFAVIHPEILQALTAVLCSTGILRSTAFTRYAWELLWYSCIVDLTSSAESTGGTDSMWITDSEHAVMPKQLRSTEFTSIMHWHSYSRAVPCRRPEILCIDRTSFQVLQNACKHIFPWENLERNIAVLYLGIPASVWDRIASSIDCICL